MSQTIFMIALTLLGTLGIFIWGPFISVAVYYLLAVLRPQFLWVWALPWGVPWSEYVAIAAIVGAAASLFLGHSSDTPTTGKNLLVGKNASAPKRKSAIGPWMLAAMGIWVILSYLNAEDSERAYSWLLEYLKVIGMFFVAAQVVRTPRQVWILFVMITVTIGYITYEMNYLYLVNGYLSIYRQGYGGLDNNGAGLMVAMGIPMALHAWEGTSQRWRWLYLASVPLMLHAVLMSYSRGAMLSLLIAAPLMLARTRFRRQMAVVAVLIAISIPILAGQEVRDRFFSIQQYQDDGSANSRFASWTAAIRIANEHPILGVGPRNSNLLSYSFGADQQGRTIHSQYLQTAADLGYVGLAFYLLVVVSAWRTVASARRTLRNRTDAEGQHLYSMANGVQCSLVIFLAGAFFLSLEVFELPYFMLLLAFLVGRLSEAPPVSEVQPDSSELVSRPRLERLASAS